MPFAKGGCMAVPMPIAIPALNTYQVADGQYILDGLAGEAVDDQALQGQAATVLNLISQIQATQVAAQMSRAFGMDTAARPDYGSGVGGGGDFANSYPFCNINTNLLWLQITNASRGTACANLYNATGQVYAIWSTTDLTLPFSLWQVEAEVWPTDTNCMPFTVLTQGRNDLFLRAEDWTGVDINGLPAWWIWEYFGNLSETAANLDVNGDTLLYDYQNGLNPNIARGADTGALQFTNGLRISVFEPKPASSIP